MDILDKTLIVQRFKEHEDYIKDEKSGKWVKKDETDNSYEKPKTRSQK
jgi:hypothetical protein